jgi:hypothetical protein
MIQQTRSFREVFWMRTIKLAFPFALILLLATCSNPSSSGPPVSLAQAQEAWAGTFAMSLVGAFLQFSGVDDGSTPGENKYRDAGGTLFIDQIPISTYPQTITLRGVGYNETALLAIKSPAR